MVKKHTGINSVSISEIIGYASSFVLGWNPYEAWSILRRLSDKINKEGGWLDWTGGNWENIYVNDLKSVVRLELLERSFLLPQVLEFDNTLQALSLEAFKIQIHPHLTEYKVPDLYTVRNKDIVPYYKGLKRTLFGPNVELSDGVCARLKDFEQTTKTFTFQKVSYFDYLKTNLAMDNANASISLRQELHQASKSVQPLRESPLANHLGINILIFSNGGEAVLHRRSREVLVRPDELCSSASGAITFRDVSFSKTESLTLADLFLNRETEEELGSKVAENVKGATSFLALTREIIRGGKPELFLFANSTLSWEEIVDSYENSEGKRRNESVEILPLNFNPYHYQSLSNLDGMDISKFKQRFENEVKKIEKMGKLSVPLLTNLALWYSYKMNGHK
jgi:hypothetical protein